jgi:hypothetical protein
LYRQRHLDGRRCFAAETLALWARTFKELIVIERYIVKTVTPLLYAAGFVPVLLAVWQIVTFVEYNIGFDNFTTIYANGDVVAAITVLFVDFIVFGALSRALIWLEQLRIPTVSDHLRHCALIYAGLLLLLFILVASYESQAGGLGYGLGIVVFVIGAYAAFLDASILFLNRRRLNRAERRGAR